MVFLFEDVNTWEVAIVLDHLERSTAASGDVGEVLLVAKLFGSGSTVATADDGEGFAFKVFDGFADGNGASLEVFLFEDAHWAIPEDHLGLADDASEELAALWTDIAAFHIFRNLFDDLDLTAFLLFEAVGSDGINWKDDLAIGFL